MVTKSFLFWLIVVSWALTSCQSAVKREAPGKSSRVRIGAPPEIATAQNPDDIEDETSAPPVPPPPAPEQPKKVAVILGPGGAKAFAHVGVLKALQQNRIPIHKVVGLEWGALMGGLFAVKGTTHDVEWKLYRMEVENILAPKGFFKRSEEPELSALDGFLKEVLGNEDLAKAKVPFMCPSRSLYSGVVTWQTRGRFREVMKPCLPFPPTLKVTGSFHAAASQLREAVEQLSKEGYNVILFVNVLGSALPVADGDLRDQATAVILWQEVRRELNEASRLSIDLINVDTSSFPMNKFAAKKELIGLGEVMGQKAASALISRYGF